MPRAKQNQAAESQIDLDIDLDTQPGEKKPRAKRKTMSPLQKQKLAAYRKLAEHAKPHELKMIEAAMAMVKMNK